MIKLLNLLQKNQDNSAEQLSIKKTTLFMQTFATKMKNYIKIKSMNTNLSKSNLI